MVSVWKALGLFQRKVSDGAFEPSHCEQDVVVMGIIFLSSVFVCALFASNRRSRRGRAGLEVGSKFAGMTPTSQDSTGTA